MKLFEFVKNAGTRLFGRDDEAAEKIKEHIEADNPGIEDLKVGFDGGKVVIAGKASEEAALEKAVLMAGNVEGVGAVELDDDFVGPRLPEPTFYTIKAGDTLWKIASETLGKGSDYPKIFEANREVIKDPNKIYPGQVIRIPRT